MILIHACEYAQQRRLPRSIEPNNANLRAIEIREINVSQDRLLVIELTDADHGVDDFVWFSGHDLNSRDYTDFTEKEKAEDEPPLSCVRIDSVKGRSM